MPTGLERIAAKARGEPLREFRPRMVTPVCRASSRRPEIRGDEFHRITQRFPLQRPKRMLPDPELQRCAVLENQFVRVESEGGSDV